MALESFKVWRKVLVFSVKSFTLMKGRYSTVVFTSFGNPHKWNHDTRLITTDVEIDLAAVSVASRADYSDVFAIICPC